MPPRKLFITINKTSFNNNIILLFIKIRYMEVKIFKILLRSYARNISTEARRKTIISDINEHEDRNIDPDTFDFYIDALNDLYIINDLEAWNPKLRSKTAIITSPTRHFVDTSIAANALNISPNDLINDPKTFGLFFEDFVIKELIVYASKINDELRHFRDANGLECDAILHLSNSKYALIEIKLGGEGLIDEVIRNLKSLQNKILKAKQPVPTFKMIITTCGDAYAKDDIYIVPINLLTD